MCSHYEGVNEIKRLRAKFGGKLPDEVFPPKNDIWPGYDSLLIRRPREAALDPHDDAIPDKELLGGRFGLIPHWVKDDKQATQMMRRCFNARSETAAKLPAFRDAWKYSRHCIIPADAIYEPDWRTGKAIPTRITAIDDEPLGVAGLWSWWQPPAGGEVHSFTMLTVNADEHDLMKSFHKPGDEKRMVVILNPDSYDAWLAASPEESMDFMRQFPADLLKAEARPTPPRQPKEVPNE